MPCIWPLIVPAAWGCGWDNHLLMLLSEETIMQNATNATLSSRFLSQWYRNLINLLVGDSVCLCRKIIYCIDFNFKMTATDSQPKLKVGSRPFVVIFHNSLTSENIGPQETHLSITEKLINLGLRKFHTIFPTVYSN